MASLRAVALGGIAAIGLPFILHGDAGMVGAQAGTYRPPVGGFAFVMMGADPHGRHRLRLAAAEGGAGGLGPLSFSTGAALPARPL